MQCLDRNKKQSINGFQYSSFHSECKKNTRPRRIGFRKIIGITIETLLTTVPFSRKLGYMNSEVSGVYTSICILTEEKAKISNFIHLRTLAASMMA